jgi:hypothetical protein
MEKWRKKQTEIKENARRKAGNIKSYMIQYWKIFDFRLSHECHRFTSFKILVMDFALTFWDKTHENELPKSCLF